MKCSNCHKEKSSVEERYSFDVYAGVLCRECCLRYRDHCGIDQEQGRASDLDEPYYED